MSSELVPGAADQSALLINAAADAAVARALQAVHVAKLKVEHVMVQTAHTQPSRTSSTPQQTPKARKKTVKQPEAVSTSRTVGKGLRHFSMKVCRKVESKGRTTYSEVADELVQELSAMESGPDEEVQHDEKNIRRRVYDAINVLMAMDIIRKEKKEIIWKGLPMLQNSSLEQLQADRLKRATQVDQKQAYLQELIEQQRALKSLLDRNPGISTVNCTTLQLPFILIQAKSDATIEVHISEDMQDVHFDFYSSPFQIHDDSAVLRNLAINLEATSSGSSHQLPHTLPGGIPTQKDRGGLLDYSALPSSTALPLDLDGGDLDRQAGGGPYFGSPQYMLP